MRFRLIKFVLFSLLALVAGAVALLWSSQWWLPAIAPSLLGAADVQVESARRVEDGRWRLEGLSLSAADAGEVAIEFAELPGLWSYCGALWRGRGWQPEQALEVGETVVTLGEPVEAADTTSRGVNWAQLFSKVNEGLAAARKWLPPLSVDAVCVEATGGNALVELSALRFDGSELNAELTKAGPGGSIALALEFFPERWELQGDSSAFPLGFKGFVRRDGPELIAGGTLAQESEVIDLKAVFSGTDALPAELVMSTSGFSLLDEWLPQPLAAEMGGIRIEEAEVKWVERAYSGELLLTATAELGGEALPVEASAGLEGDFNKMRIQELDIHSPWLEASLQEPLAVGLGDGSISEAAEFRFAADLSKQSFFEAKGELLGALTFQPPGELLFDLTGDGIRVAGYAVKELALEGRGDRSGIDVESMELGFPEETPGQVKLDGRYDLEQSYLKINYGASLTAAFLSEYAGLPGFEEGAVLKGEVEGDPAEPAIRGELEAGVVNLPRLRPLELSARFSLQELRSGEFDLTLNREDEGVNLLLSASLVDEGRIEGDVKAFAWQSGSGQILKLGAPSSFGFPLRGSPAVWFAETLISGLEIEGRGGRVSLRKQSGEALQFAAADLLSTRLSGWLEEPLPKITVREAAVEVSSLTPKVKGAVSLVIEDERPQLGLIRAEIADLELDRRLDIGVLKLSLDGALLLQAEAELPVQVAWDDGEGGPRVKAAEEGSLRAQVQTVASEPLAAIIEDWTGLSVESPEVEVELDGSLKQPKGSVRLRLSALGFDGFKLIPDLPQPLPEIEKVDLELRAGGDRLELERISASIRGGSLTVTGDWPLPDGFWRGKFGEGDWRERLRLARYELGFRDWQLEQWTPYLPDMLRRSGRLGGSLRHEPETGFSGSVRFDELALRATQDFPAVDSIGGIFQVEDETLNLTDASARVGGSPVSVKGEVSWPTWPELEWAVEVSGKNVPIVRRPEMILRSDLDVALRSGAEHSAAELSGRLGLRSSTMLVEFDPLSPPVRSGPSARPPFFEVEETPFDRWALDLRIEGDRFLRVRSPYFQSLLSAGFDLSGTLGQPLLLGALRIEEGHLSFPGAKLRLDSGEAFIEAAQPNTLRLDVAGTTRVGAHVITMQVGGSAAEPQVHFEASPPLPNTAIVRLLSTGSATGGGAGAVGLYLGRGLLGAGGMKESLGDRLTIDFGEETTRSGRSAVGMQYDIRENLSLQGEYDVYDSYNMDLLWTIFKK